MQHGHDRRTSTPHLRIEHRVVPAGPTISDSIANAALYYGAVQALLTASPWPETLIPFPVARANFYAAARLGLEALRPWDLAVDPSDAPPLAPYHGQDELIQGSLNIFERVDPGLARQY